MTLLQSIILGLLQGVAEFLPISSSGHLAIAQNLFGLEEVPLLFDVFLHLATLLAVVIFFRKKIWALLCAFGRLIARKPYKEEGASESLCAAKEKNLRNYILAIILATVVTGVLGIVVEKGLDDLPIQFVCAGLIVTACILVASSLVEKAQAKKAATSASEAATSESPAASDPSSTATTSSESIPPAEKSPSWWQALIIGLAQGLGTLPGISRSGSTIAGSLFCGVNRAQAGEFSFIVSIPAILGAFLLEVKDLGEVTSSIGVLPLVVGCLTAFVSGYAALAWLMRLIKKGRLEWFACYLIPAGILGLIFLH